MLVAAIVALAGIAATGFIARTRVDLLAAPPHESGTEIDWLRSFAVSTRLLAWLSFAAMIFTALPIVILSDSRLSGRACSSASR